MDSYDQETVNQMRALFPAGKAMGYTIRVIQLDSGPGFELVRPNGTIAFRLETHGRRIEAFKAVCKVAFDLGMIQRAN